MRIISVGVYAILLHQVLSPTRIFQLPLNGVENPSATLFQKSSLGDANPMMPRGATEGAIFVVYRQPIALDRFTLHDVQPVEAAGAWAPHTQPATP